MQRAATFVALIFAMLTATLHSAEAAHPVAGSAEAAQAVQAHGHEHAPPPDSGEADDQAADRLAHHHCPAAWVPDATPPVPAVPCTDALLIAKRHSAMPSRADDPLLEPPSA